MAKIRLTEWHRDYLRTLASEVIACPAETEADKAAYLAAMPLVRAIVCDRYPPKDMKVLAKYQAAKPDTCLRMQLTAGGVVEFKFRDVEAAPLAPDGSCYNRMYIANAEATAAIEAHFKARDALTKIKKAKLDDYKALISGAATLEEVEAVWSEASKLRERIAKTLPAVLSNDVIARIKADVAKRLKPAALAKTEA